MVVVSTTVPSALLQPELAVGRGQDLGLAVAVEVGDMGIAGPGTGDVDEVRVELRSVVVEGGLARDDLEVVVAVEVGEGRVVDVEGRGLVAEDRLELALVVEDQVRRHDLHIAIVVQVAQRDRGPAGILHPARWSSTRPRRHR